MQNLQSETIISEIILSHERQINRIISFFEDERKEKQKQKQRISENISKSLDKSLKYLKNTGILAAITTYLLQDKSSNSGSESDLPLANDIPLIVCCKWLNHYFETNNILQSFIKKTLRKEVYDKLITLINSISSKDFEINLKEFKEELTQEDLQDLNSIDPRLSEMEKMLLIKIING